MLRHVFTLSAANNLQRLKLFNRRQYALLSESFKTTVETQLEPPQVDRQLVKKFTRKNYEMLPFELETFVTSLLKNMDTSVDKRDEVHDKLIELRKSAALMPKTLNHCVVNYFLVVNAEDLLTVLSDKMRYGVFIDAFTGCYLMDIFLAQKDFKKAIQIAAELMLQEDYDDVLVQAFSLLSAFQFVQHKISDDWKSLQKAVSTENTEVKGNDKRTKVRVKFLRNPTEKEMLNISSIDAKLIASLFVNCVRGLSNETIKTNSLLLANIINGDFKQAETLINSNKSVFCKDVAEISLDILKTIDEAELEIQKLKTLLEEVKQSSNGNYFSTLNEFAKDSLKPKEATFISEQKKMHQTWLNDRTLQLENLIKNEQKVLREESVQQDLHNIEEKWQKLWFFETQDKIDMQIFRKQVRYPKRWFGKKKKPRAVDDNYVPPDIRTEYKN